MGKIRVVFLGSKGLTALVIIALLVMPLFAEISQSHASRPNALAKTEMESGNQPIAVQRTPPPYGNLSLRVIDDSSKQGIAGAKVEIRTRPAGQIPLSDITNSTGFVFFDVLIPGSYALQVSQGNYVTQFPTVFVSNKTVNYYEVRLQKSGSLNVRVVDASSGNPIQYVDVVLMDVSSTYMWTSWTNQSGFVFFYGLTPGSYTISVSKSNYTHYNMDIAVVSGQNTLQIVELTPQYYTGLGQPVEALSAVSIGGLIVLVSLVALLAMRRRRSLGRGGTGSQRSRLESMPEVVDRQPTAQETILSRPRRSCPYCGTTIETSRGDFCPKCGADKTILPRPSTIPEKTQRPKVLEEICIVCKLRIAKGDEIVRCPHCGYNAHRTHMLEWLHVNGSCPVCHRNIDEKDLVQR